MRRSLCALLLLSLSLFSSITFAYEGDRGEAFKFYKSGQKYEAQEKFGKAVNAYYHAILMDPDFPIALRSIGRVYMRKGLHKDALDTLNQALFLDKFDPETHYYLGIVSPMVEHKNENSLEHFREFLKLSPGDSKRRRQVEKWVEKMSSTGNVPQDTGPISQHTLDTKKEEVQWYNKGMELAGAGKHQDAVEAFDKAIALHAGYAEAHYALGAAYASLGDKVKAVTHFWKYLELKPNASDLKQVIERIAKLEQG